MENDKERNIADKDSMLNILIETFQKSNSSDIVNESKCKSIGLITYEEKKEKKMSECFLISVTHGGKTIDLIYDEKGQVLASKSEKNGMKLELSDDINLDAETLDLQLNLAEERTRENNNGSTSSSDTTKAGDGRDLGNKEHEEKEEVKDKQENFEKNKIELPENKLENLKDKGIDLAGQPLIKLDQMINGHYFWQLLGLEEKFEGRLPDGVNPKAFRTGYLSVVKSKDLTAKDGKERKSEDTLVVTTFDRSQIIELDEQVLRPVDLGPKSLQAEIRQSSYRREDGEEARKQTSTTDGTRTSMYQIPGVNDRFNVAEDYYIGVDWDRDYMQAGGKRPASGYKQELYFVQTSRNGSYEERQRGDNALEYKLKPDAEPVIGDAEKNAKQEEDLRKKSSHEVIETRKEHFNELVEKCFEKIPELGDNFNRSDVEKMVEDYHNRGLNDEKVVEAVREDCDIAQDVEHDMPGRDPRRQ